MARKTLKSSKETNGHGVETMPEVSEQAIRELASVGRQVLKVPIDVEAYAMWCRERGCRLDSASRAEYVTERLHTQQSPKLDSSSPRSR